MGLCGSLDEFEDFPVEDKCQQHDQFEKRMDQRLQLACDEHRNSIALIRQDICDMWPRLRGIELKIAWGTGILGGLFFVFQIMPWLMKLFRWMEGR